MTATLLVVTLGWLTLLFALARLAEARESFRRFSNHPLVYSSSLVVYATSWTFLGAVGLARTQGLTFLAVSVGPLLSALLVPAVWLPLFRILRRHQLATVADLFAFRYRSQALGFAVFTGQLRMAGPSCVSAPMLLTWSLYFSPKHGLEVPTRPAYSHSP